MVTGAEGGGCDLARAERAGTGMVVRGAAGGPCRGGAAAGLAKAGRRLQHRNCRKLQSPRLALTRCPHFPPFAAPPHDVARYRWLVDAGSNASEPQQVHASYGQDPMTSLQFVWSTRSAADTILRFGEFGKPMTSFANGTSAPFDEPTQFIHRAAATGLRAGTKYSYVVGSPAGGWSNISTMTTAPTPGSAEAGALVFAVYGDMGLNNERSLAWLVKDIEAGNFDAVLHVGDLGYDLDSDG